MNLRTLVGVLWGVAMVAFASHLGLLAKWYSAGFYRNCPDCDPWWYRVFCGPGASVGVLFLLTIGIVGTLNTKTIERKCLVLTASILIGGGSQVFGLQASKYVQSHVQISPACCSIWRSLLIVESCATSRARIISLRGSPFTKQKADLGQQRDVHVNQIECPRQFDSPQR